MEKPQGKKIKQINQIWNAGVAHEIKAVLRFLIQPSEMRCKKVFILKEPETNYQVSSSKTNIPAATLVRRDVCFRDATTYRKRKKNINGGRTVDYQYLNRFRDILKDETFLIMIHTLQYSGFVQSVPEDRG